MFNARTKIYFDGYSEAPTYYKAKDYAYNIIHTL